MVMDEDVMHFEASHGTADGFLSIKGSLVIVLYSASYLDAHSHQSEYAHSTQHTTINILFLATLLPLEFFTAGIQHHIGIQILTQEALYRHVKQHTCNAELLLQNRYWCSFRRIRSLLNKFFPLYTIYCVSYPTPMSYSFLHEYDSPEKQR